MASLPSGVRYLKDCLFSTAVVSRNQDEPTTTRESTPRSIGRCSLTLAASFGPA
jgi:hypothetical protein